MLQYNIMHITGPYPEPFESSPHPYTLFVNDEAGRIHKEAAMTYLKVISQNIPERNEENHKKP
jgi:hypothetical protein